MRKTQLSGVALVLCLAMASCAQPQRMVGVKQPASNQLCDGQRECVVKVVMSVEHGQCVYDLPENVFVPRAVDTIRWDLQPAPTAKEVFRFPAAKLPVAQKAGDKGPPFTGPVPGQREPIYTVRRDAAKTAGLTFYKMAVEYQESGGGGFRACVDLDPVIINMP